MTAAAAPGWVRRVLGQELTDARRLPWGFTNESWTATTSGGQRLVATRMADPRSAAWIIGRTPEIAHRLAAAGLPTPRPVAASSDAALGVVVAELIEGETAIERLDTEEGARSAGRVLGDVWRRLATVDTSGLDLDDLWARPADLGAAARDWLHAIGPALPARVAAGVRARVDEVAGLLAHRRPSFVHGDFVPVNVLIREGRLAALLDLEAVRLGEPLLDPAWLRWIVRFHHPVAVSTVWAACAEAGGINETDPVVARLLAILPTLRLLEILTRAGLARDRQRGWVEQLAASLAE